VFAVTPQNDLHPHKGGPVELANCSASVQDKEAAAVSDGKTVQSALPGSSHQLLRQLSESFSIQSLQRQELNAPAQE
jgi:hypothetical protein